MTQTLSRNLRIVNDLNSLDPYVRDLAEEQADRIERELYPQDIRESWTEQCSEA